MNLLCYSILPLLLLLCWNYILAQQYTPCRTPNRSRGQCINIRYCQPLLSLLERQRPLPPSTINFLLQSNCGYEGITPLVCCPMFTVGQQGPPPPPPVNQSPGEHFIQDVTHHPRLASLLPDYCGSLVDDNKITNGDDSSLFEFPWMALLAYTSNSGPAFSYRCGGTIINRRYILTAAHCLLNTDYMLIEVRLGEHDLRTDRDCQDVCAPPVQDIAVEEIIPHPRYRRPEKNDIGLIRLQWDITFNAAVRPVCLPVGTAQQQNLNGQKVTVTGWGTTEFGTNSHILRKVDVPIVTVSRCAQIYNASAQITIQHICAGGTEGKDSCAGDSGGPLQTLAQKAGELVYIQFGVVSFGPRHCGSRDMPGVYTRVGYYMQWILDNMRL